MLLLRRNNLTPQVEWSPTQIVSVGSVKYGRQRVNLIAVKLSHWTVPIIALTNKVLDG